MSIQLQTDQPCDAAGRARLRYHDMTWVPGGTFLMGSERHYPEEAPVHRVTVTPFWMDCTSVTNRQFLSIS